MPKMKTNRAAAKRMRKTGTGKIKRMRANKSHILTKKDRKRKRRLRSSTLVLMFLCALPSALALRARYAGVQTLPGRLPRSLAR